MFKVSENAQALHLALSETRWGLGTGWAE